MISLVISRRRSLADYVNITITLAKPGEVVFDPSAWMLGWGPR